MYVVNSIVRDLVSSGTGNVAKPELNLESSVTFNVTGYSFSGTGNIS